MPFDENVNFDFSVESSTKQDILKFIHEKLNANIAQFDAIAKMYTVQGVQIISVNEQSYVKLLISFINQHVCKGCIKIIRKEDWARFCDICTGYGHPECVAPDGFDEDSAEPFHCQSCLAYL